MINKILITLTLIQYSYGSRVKRIVGGIPADIPPEDDPVIFTRFAGKTARIVGTRDYPHYVFRGLPYAHPPVKNERFLRPREKLLEGYINATSFPQPCIQPVPGQNRVVGSEDCLFLNVFTPQLPTGTEGLPVIVWIHGGGFRYGSASQYGVRHLVSQQVVIVTIQYRLGSMGFLSSGGKDLPGNAALWDMALATQFVRNYIGFFGGNPNKIVVMGHGSGGSSALLMTLSNIAKGITGVIAMSGTAVSNWAIDNAPERTAKDIANELGCPTASVVTMIKCLQNLPPEAIIRTDSDLENQRIRQRGFISGLSGTLTPSPVMEGRTDGRSLPSLVQNDPLVDMENPPKIALLTGVTKDETKTAINGQFRSEVLKNLQKPDFLNNGLIKDLQGLLHINSSQNGNLLGLLNPLNFKNYVKSATRSLNESLWTVAYATNDALFGVPAFLTANLWGKNGAPTYLYSFEHCGKRKKGYEFLRGIPIIGNETSESLDDTVSHGDDLAYLFDAQDLFGNGLETPDVPSEDDSKVRSVFTKLIVDFAYNSKISIGNQNLDPFAKSNNFIQIKPVPKVSTNYKFCEMALWCNLADRLKSSTCSFLNALDQQLSGVKKTVSDTFGGLNSLMSNPNLKNFGSNSQSKSEANSQSLLRIPGIF